MTPPLIVVYAADRLFRVQCDALVRRAGGHVRLASRQAELAKAMGEGVIAAVIAGDDGREGEAARALASALAVTSSTPVPVMQRAPGESIEEIVARALAAATPAATADQPRSSE